MVQKGIKYFGDGSGRDAYVITNGGGTLKTKKTRGQILKDYSENKISFEKNREASLQTSVLSPITHHASTKSLFGHSKKLSTSVAHLNDIGRPMVKENLGPVARTMKIRNKYGERFQSQGSEGSCLVLPALNIAKKNVRGYKHFIQSMDEDNCEFITCKHGSRPFINFNSLY